MTHEKQDDAARLGGSSVERQVRQRPEDGTLLVLAAQAAGIEGRYFSGSSAIHTGIYRAKHRYYWNPLASDSEALRLAAELNFDICVNICFCEVVWVNMVTSETFEVKEDWGGGDVELSDRMEYIRRAIVRMAAKVASLTLPNVGAKRT